MSRRQKYSILNIFLSLLLVAVVGYGVSKGDKASAGFITSSASNESGTAVDLGDGTVQFTFTGQVDWSRDFFPNTGEDQGVALWMQNLDTGTESDAVEYHLIPMSNYNYTGSYTFDSYGAYLRTCDPITYTATMHYNFHTRTYHYTLEDPYTDSSILNARYGSNWFYAPDGTIAVWDESWTSDPWSKSGDCSGPSPSP